jgi:tricorn protease
MRGTTLLATALVLAGAPTVPAEPIGYYRQPALHGDTLVFVAEGDLWRVPVTGGPARRLTSHIGDESLPAISPDGKTVAFAGQYEGVTEVYTMPLAGGAPVRQTFHGSPIASVAWTPDGKILYGSRAFSSLPGVQLAIIDPTAGRSARAPRRVPLAEAADGCFADDGRTLFFTRLPFQGSHTKHYRGGTAQNLWRFAEGDSEATPLTADYPGTSKQPQWWQGRVYFASDRDGTMNLWSMAPDGKDLRRHTEHRGWDVSSPSLHDGRVAYQLGADLRLLDLRTGQDGVVPITLDSDFDQTRERWLPRPAEFLTGAHLSPDGGRVALTARGQVFVAPHREGRLVEVSRAPGVRYRDARFLPEGQRLVVLSDQSGEVELWTLPANGVGAAAQLTRDGDVLRWEGVPSPDGRWVAHRDKNQRLHLFDLKANENKKIDESPVGEFTGLSWSPDGQWLAYISPAENTFGRVKLYRVSEGKSAFVTTDRYDSDSPTWSADGQWLYFLSDRNLQSVVPSPWGTYQPEPFFDKKSQIFHVALKPGQRSPFAPPDELHAERKGPARPASGGASGKEDAEEPKPAVKPPVKVEIDLDGLAERLERVPVPAGNFTRLSVNDKGLFWLSRPVGETRSTLQAVTFAREGVEVKTVAEGVQSYELSLDGKKLLVVRALAGPPRPDPDTPRETAVPSLAILDAIPTPPAPRPGGGPDKTPVNLAGWALAVQPREEWRQMFAEAWRLERDYFYDRGMHGLDWPAVRKKYEPLVDRVSTRAELSDLIAQMVSELSALHIFVRGGDVGRPEVPRVQAASLGADLSRDEADGGYRVGHVIRHDPDEPDRAPPLSRPGVGVREGDVIEQVNGTSTLSVPDVHLLFRHQAGRQVLLRVKPKSGGASRDVVVRPISPTAAADLRYHEWEYDRRRVVEKAGRGRIGYVHLRTMGPGDIADFARGYYPVFNRQGLIIDVRHNGGGNIDSWVLNRLLRRPWFYWNQRIGRRPQWNMQYAFRGHLVVLCDQFTGSDGEAFSEGFRRLGLGKVIGSRTWGGEIWLTSSNFLVDRGIATAAEFGVYGPEGTWLIEGHGVDPDIVVDNLPHATFKGEDAQLRAALEHLEKRIKEQPVPPMPAPPKFPDKSDR